MMSTYDIDADADADARDGMVSSPGATFQDAKSRLALGDTKPLSHAWDAGKNTIHGMLQQRFSPRKWIRI